MDLSGTNTDSVLLDTTASATSTASILAWNKTTTTPDITSGIQRATAELLNSASVNVDGIVCVTLGTTVCTGFAALGSRSLTTCEAPHQRTR